MAKWGPKEGDKLAPAKCMGNYEGSYKGLKSGFPKAHEGNAQMNGESKGGAQANDGDHVGEGKGETDVKGG